MAWLRSLLLNLQFSTIVPTPQIRDVKVNELRASMAWFPLVGFGLGGLTYGVMWLLASHLSVWPAAVLAVAVYTVATGGIHVDGLMDTADALGSRKPAPQALAIMKDSRIGAFGGMAGCLVLVAKIVAIANMSGFDLQAVVAVPVCARMGIVWAMALVRPATPDSGLGAVYARKLPAWVVAGSTGSALLLTALVMPSLRLCGLWAATLLLTTLFCWTMVWRFGGMTGDTYGALNECLEWLGYLVLAWH